jgi:hypothetical protein
MLNRQILKYFDRNGNGLMGVYMEKQNNHKGYANGFVFKHGYCTTQ